MVGRPTEPIFRKIPRSIFCAGAWYYFMSFLNSSQILTFKYTYVWLARTHHDHSYQMRCLRMIFLQSESFGWFRPQNKIEKICAKKNALSYFLCGRTCIFVRLLIFAHVHPPRTYLHRSGRRSKHQPLCPYAGIPCVWMDQTSGCILYVCTWHKQPVCLFLFCFGCNDKRLARSPQINKQGVHSLW